MDIKHNNKPREIRAQDRIEGNHIILDGEGVFPKHLIILMRGHEIKYEIRRTEHGRFLLNK